jgi:RNA ligase (TIGR02306 family)
MARKLASIVEIESCEPIPDTERLSVATMKGKGWKVVTGRDEYHAGDLAVYFEIDSFLKSDDERYAFLKDRCLKKFVSKSGNVLREGIRIKTIKLRGVISQGLLMPLSAFVGKEILVRNQLAKPEDVVAEDGKPVSQEELAGVYISTLYYLKDITEEGEAPTIKEVEVGVDSDLTELLHVEHYDEVKESLQPQTGSAISADAMGNFPSAFVPKTDEERIQNLGDWFEKMKGRKWQVTVKADGTSCTIAYSPTIDFENPGIVCSRNLRLKNITAAGVVPLYWQMNQKYNILGKLAEALVGGMEYAIQGEVVGPGIQKDRNKESEFMFKCFRIWDIANQKFLNPNETVAFCKEFDIPHVEVLKTDFPFFDEITTMEDALKFAEGKTKEGNEREGVVLKTCDDGPYASFKIVSNKYLMKQED